MAQGLYTIIIYPLYQIVEFVYRVFFAVCKNQGIAIIGVSIAITLLCLPLYAVAERWQETERAIQKQLQPGIARIKKAFKGDEQYMMLSTFYKEHHYHPMMALRSSFSLLIQVPFFMAAYSYLSHSEELAGHSFLFITDLALPDSLFSIGFFTVNILPIVMTIINCIAGAIYTKGFRPREKIQIYAMALFFLVILYNSPAGLVLYWTMNNVFSLCKHIFYKLHNPLQKLYILICALLVLVNGYLVLKQFKYAAFIVILSLLIAAIPLYIKITKHLLQGILVPLVQQKSLRTVLFFLSMTGLCILTSLVIPTLLMASSPVEYCYIDGYDTPAFFIKNTFLQAVGLFLFWPACVYLLFDKKTQTVLSVVSVIAFICALIDCFVFEGNYGTILPELFFAEHRSFIPTKTEFLLNVGALGTAVIILFLLCIKKQYKAVTNAVGILCVALLCNSIINITTVYKGYKTTPKPQDSAKELEPIIHLSKTGKNVVVFMLDRATGYLFPDLLQEHPDIYNHFTGFTFYSNTVSMGRWTIQGAPGLYGGYEYTPWQMNHKRDIPMVEKHNQAESLLPFIFEKSGYTCDVIDPPYPNYDSAPIYKVFEGHKDIHPVSAIGKYSQLWYKENNYEYIPVKSTLIKRNMIWFSLFRIAPNFLRSAIHFNDWWAPTTNSKQQSNANFIDRYSILDYLPRLTSVSENEGKNGFVIIDSEAPHDVAFCQAPEYRPAKTITNYGSSPWAHDEGYHGLAASFLCLNTWLDYLKEQGVYDNTRIIFVADHGSHQNSPLFDDPPAGYPHRYEWYNCLLLIKDFNETGTMRIDNTFMTNADTPALATRGVIENPVNPYTGNPIRFLTHEERNKNAILSASQANAVRSTENNGFKIKDSEWYTVHDNIFDKNNWEKMSVK